MKNKEIVKIISKSFDRGLSYSEQTQLDEWIALSNENKIRYETYLKLWRQAETIATDGDIDVEAALVKTKGKIKSFKKAREFNYSFLKVAATIAVFLSFGYAAWYFGYNSAQNGRSIIYQEVMAMHGTNTQLQLADGTDVWLNSGSKLRFPTTFENTDERNVVLTGEAYFDVKSNKEKAFVVETNDIDVRVHGTSFNVSAYQEDTDVTVALVEGKVSLEKERDGNTVPLVELSPSQVVSFNKKNESVNTIGDMKMNQFIGWKEGLIVFYGDSIENVSDRLSKWYSVDFEIEPSLYDYRFTATIQNESLEQVLDLLCISSPMAYEILPAKLSDNQTFTNRKVKLTRKN